MLKQLRQQPPEPHAMCRNIKSLFNFDPPVTEEEVRAASLQFVRKVCGFTKPSKANDGPFAAAVDDVSAIVARLLQSLETTATPRNRADEAAKAKNRALRRYGGRPEGSSTGTSGSEIVSPQR
jgi:hypothetical protein